MKSFQERYIYTHSDEFIIDVLRDHHFEEKDYEANTWKEMVEDLKSYRDSSYDFQELKHFNYFYGKCLMWRFCVYTVLSECTDIEKENLEFILGA